MDFNWKAAYDRMHQTFPGRKRQPVIGITGNFGERGCELAEGYYRSILEAGGTPMVIPPYEDRDALLEALDRVDGLLLSGGGDLNPLYLGEQPSPALHSICPQRDLAELLLIRLAFDRQIPMLGICRGIQMMAAALDGSVHQDIAEGFSKNKQATVAASLSPSGRDCSAVADDSVAVPLIKHSQSLPREYASHTIYIKEASLLHQVLGTTELPVNSFHHQAVREAGTHLCVSATAPDGVIEAVESTEHKSLLGVQWHPECFILRGDRTMLPIFEWLVGEARSYREARDVHSRILTLDSHCDTPMFFHQGIHFDQRDPRILVDLHKMTEGGLDASIMVAYLPQGERDDATLRATTAKAEQLLNQIEQLAAANCTAIDIARTSDDLYRLKAAGKHAVMLGIENGYAIGRDLSLIEHFRQRGVVYMTLCHNGDNDICDSARGNAEHGGLSDFGRQVIREMNRVGMMVDLSHAAESSFWQALELSQTPIVCSHSSCRALCDHPRNLTDDQMKALARRGGVMQVTLYEGFLRRDGQASILDVIEHINHAVSVMGIDHVGIGTDFDGDGGVPGIASASEVINLTRRLLRERYSEADLRKLWGENFLRVMREALTLTLSLKGEGI